MVTEEEVLEVCGEGEGRSGRGESERAEEITRLKAASGAHLRDICSVLLKSISGQMSDFELPAGRKPSLWPPLCYVPTRSLELNTCLLMNE